MAVERSINYQNATISYSVEGAGKPVVLLHGFGEDSSVFHDQIAYLKASCQLIVPDIPGSGKSDFLEGAESMDDYAAVVKLILEREDIDTCIMIGHSMGGYITLAFAEKFPELISAMGLFHSSAYADDEEKIQNRKKGIDFIQEHGAAKFLAQATPILFSEVTRSNRPALVQELISRYNNFNSNALVQYYEAMIIRPDRTAVLKATNKPVLFILGEHDTIIPLEKGLEQATLPGICYIHILKTSGHMGMLEDTPRANEVLEKFISEVHVEFSLQH